MRANQAGFPIVVMAEVLGVSRAGYYAWLRKKPSQRETENTRLTQRIEAVHKASLGIYGEPKITEEIQESGENVNRKRVARLMKKAGIRGVCRRKFVVTTAQDKTQESAPDLVKRAFKANAPNQLYVSDITYIPTCAGFLYLAVVMDVFSRKIVGWSMKTSLHAEIVVEALDMAISQRKPTNVIHHSDKGRQYTSILFGKRCKEANVRLSMGAVGDAYDNAMAESFFATLEFELLARTRFKNQEEAKRAVFDYIEGFYNTRRRHSAIDYKSPIIYERHYEQQQQIAA